MEPPDTFSRAYSQTITKGVSYFSKHPYNFLACRNFFAKQHPQASDQDFLKFHEIILKQGKLTTDLIVYSYTIGQYKETKELADRLSYLEISQACAIRLGNNERIEEFERPPRPDCHVAHLSNWLKYHSFRTSLYKATKNFTHVKKDGNALVQLYRGNFSKTLELLTGDMLEGHEDLLFKAICHAALGHPTIETDEHFNRAILSGSVISNTFEPFQLLSGLSHSQRPEKLDQISQGVKFPSLELMFFGSESGVRNPTNCSYVSFLAKEHKNPYLRFFNLILTAKKAERVVGAKVIFALMKNEPVQMLDQSIFIYLGRSSWSEAYTYMAERFNQTPHPYILSYMICAKFEICKDTNHDPLHVKELQELIDRFLEMNLDRDNILVELGYLAKQRGEFEKAKDLYLESLHIFGPKNDIIIYLSATLEKLGDINAGIKLLLDTVKRNKSLPLLKAVEDALIRHSRDKDLVHFYTENCKFEPLFAQKVKDLKTRLLETHKHLSAAEASKLPLDTAILVLRIRFDLNSDAEAQSYLSLCHYYKGNKEESIKVFKELYARNNTLAVSYLITLLPEHAPYVCSVIPCVSKNHSLYNLLAIKAYFLNEEYDKVLEPSLAQINLTPDDRAPYIKRLMSFYYLGNVIGTLRLLEMVEERGWMTSELRKIKAETEEKRAAQIPSTQDKTNTPKKEKKRAGQNPHVDPFKLEKKDITEAKKSHLERESCRVAADSPATHSGSKSIKGSVDPIVYKKRFNPLDFKPKEDEPEEVIVPAAAIKPAPREAPPALFEINLNPNQKNKVVFAIERLSDLIQLEKREIDPALKNAIHFRNHLYTYIKLFGILSELARPPLKDALYSKRNDARHEFMACSLNACENVLNYFKQINLVSQMEAWVQGGIINNLSISQFNLRDNIENRKFEQMNAAEKNSRRLAFMKEEIDLLIQIKKSIPSIEDFEKEGHNQIALKMSIMMLGHSWKGLNPQMKALLAPHFRVLNLEGNKGAHNIKGETKHHNITFKLGFDDITQESLWNFAQSAEVLKTVLIGIN